MMGLVVVSLLMLQALSVNGQTGWVTIGRGCCADADNNPVTSTPAASLTGITSAGQCRSASEALPGTDAAAFDKNAETCIIYYSGEVFTTFSDYYGCLATIRCLRYYPPTPTEPPTEAPDDQDDASFDEEDSNFSVQGGEFAYLTSFFSSYTPVFGIISGRAQLVRTALGVSKVSVAFKVGLSLEVGGRTQAELEATTFLLKLHSDTCANDGGLSYQNPYVCSQESGGRCSEALVSLAAANADALEIQFDISVNTNNYFEAIAEIDWPVYIPNEFLGQSRETLSVVMYDPIDGVPMTCADLKDDRDLEGVLYYINTQDVPFVPVITESHLTRTERGSTNVGMTVQNLPSDRTFRLYVHSTSCVPLPGIPSAAQLRGGDVYMRDITCYGRIDNGDIECASSESNNTMMIEFSGSSGSETIITALYPFLARADAASLILYVCDVAGCETDTTMLNCVDLENDDPALFTTTEDPVTQIITPGPTPSPSSFPTPSPSASPVVDRTGEFDVLNGERCDRSVVSQRDSDFENGPTSLESCAHSCFISGTCNAFVFTQAGTCQKYIDCSVRRSATTQITMLRRVTASPTDPSDAPSRAPTTLDPTSEPTRGPSRLATKPAVTVLTTRSTTQPDTTDPQFRVTVDTTEYGSNNGVGGEGGAESGEVGVFSECPAIHAAVAGGKGGMYDMQLSQVEFVGSALFGCCLASTAPDGLISFSLGSVGATATQLSIAAVVTVAAAFVVVIGFGGLVAYRKHLRRGYDKIDNTEYANPSMEGTHAYSFSVGLLSPKRPKNSSI